MRHRILTLVRLEVSRDDIEKMYDLYDSGMADRTTANAICLALHRKLRSEFRPRIRCAARHSGCRLEFGSEFFPLPSEVFWWLDLTNKGGSVKPASFVIALPRGVLCGKKPAKDALETAISA